MYIFPPSSLDKRPVNLSERHQIRNRWDRMGFCRFCILFTLSGLTGEHGFLKNVVVFFKGHGSWVTQEQNRLPYHQEWLLAQPTAVHIAKTSLQCQLKLHQACWQQHSSHPHRWRWQAIILRGGGSAPQWSKWWAPSSSVSTSWQMSP